MSAATQPSRRIIRALAADSPLIGQHLVAVTGDGVSFNTMYRDGDVAWPIRELSIPLVFFAHENPVAWTAGEGPTDSTSTKPPNATDDVLLFADIIRVIAQGIFLGERVADADELAANSAPASRRTTRRKASDGPAKASTSSSSARNSARVAEWPAR